MARHGENIYKRKDGRWEKLYELSKQQWKKGTKGYEEKVTRLIGTYTPKQLFENNVVYNVFGGSL